MPRPVFGERNLNSCVPAVSIAKQATFKTEVNIFDVTFHTNMFSGGKCGFDMLLHKSQKLQINQVKVLTMFVPCSFALGANMHL